MTDNYKIDKLISFISITYCWCIKAGKIFKTKDTKIRKDTGYSRKIIFKIDLESVSTSIIQKHFKPKKYLKCINVFEPYSNDPSHFVVA